MKIKIFTTDKNGKITLSKDELQDIVNEAYYEGYRNGEQNGKSYIITSPHWWDTPYYSWSVSTDGSSSITIGSDPNTSTITQVSVDGTTTISKDKATSDSITINADNLTNKLKQHEYYI